VALWSGGAVVDESTLRLTFPEAIAYLKAKIPLGSTSYKTYEGQLQDVVFSVAGITKASLLADIQAIVIRQLEQGVDIGGFKKNFNGFLEKAGWNLAGDASAPRVRAYRAELVISQNVRTSYSRGRWEQMRSPTVAKTRKYWEWRHRDSRVPRPHHLKLDGMVFPADAEVWRSIFPPPFSCKCTAHALSDRDLERLGLTVSEPPPLDTIAEKGFDQGFSDLPKERERLLSEAQKRLPPEFANLLAESATFAEAIEAALNGTLDFAAPLFGKGARAKGKKPNCTSGKSHFCQTPNGRGLAYR
jgi:SPP1 gp7 family putative phage head morphogenesis protein